MLESKFNNRGKELEIYQKLLDSPKEKKYIDIANKIMPKSNFTRANKELGEIISKNKIKSKIKEISSSFNRKVLAKEEIKEECYRYNLKFIHSVRYEGELDIDYVKKVSDFLESNNFIVSDYDYTQKIYFLVPNKGVKNPITFFEYEGFYIMIDNNKNYANIFRLFYGFVKHNKWSQNMLFFSLSNIVLSFVAFLDGFSLALFSTFIGIINILNFIFFLNSIPDSKEITKDSNQNSNIKKTYNYIKAFLISFFIYSFYLFLSLIYTFNPVFKTEVRKREIKFTEVRDLGYDVKPGKNYYYNDTITKEIIGYYLFFTINKKHKIQNKNESIYSY